MNDANVITHMPFMMDSVPLAYWILFFTQFIVWATLADKGYDVFKHNKSISEKWEFHLINLPLHIAFVVLILRSAIILFTSVKSILQLNLARNIKLCNPNSRMYVPTTVDGLRHLQVLNLKPKFFFAIAYIMVWTIPGNLNQMQQERVSWFLVLLPLWFIFFFLLIETLMRANWFGIDVILPITEFARYFNGTHVARMIRMGVAADLDSILEDDDDAMAMEESKQLISKHYSGGEEGGGGGGGVGGGGSSSSAKENKDNEDNQ